MRTETVTTTYEIYNYNELSASAKENVKRWYLDGRDTDDFEWMCKEDLFNLFGENNLYVQYSLSSCQGDGFNIYGQIEAKSIFNCLENNNGGTQLEKFKDFLTDEEKKTILQYAEECGDISLPYNNRYCYSMADYINILDNWSYDLEFFSWNNDVNMELLEKFEKMVKGIFGTLCKDYERQGYDYFYEVSEEDLEDYCESFGYEFLEDGTVY